jgi:anti-sigma regulatory factor (Ser/Thr protein kinase)
MATRRFPRRLDALDAIAAFVEEFLGREGLAPDHGFDLNLVIEELFANQVRHARGGRDEIELALSYVGGRLTVRLTDFDVEPFDPTSAPEVDTSAPIETRRVGGLGIHLVRRIAEDLRYDHRGGDSTLTATWRIPR